MRSGMLNFDAPQIAQEPDAGSAEEKQGETIVVGFEAGEKLYCALTVVGQIEGHVSLGGGVKTTKYEHVIPKLVQIEQDKNIAGLLLLLNTVGGDIEAGLALSELIAGMRKPTVSLVLGGGHSIGVPLAVAAKRSFIVPTATMTLHPVRMNGTVLGVPQTMDYFRDIQERIVDFVCSHSGILPDRFRELMLSPGMLVTDLGTILRGEAAVKEGLIGAVGHLGDAIEALIGM